MKKLWQWMGTALLVAIFLSLANWQWNRAAELKKPIEIDQSISPIDSVIAPEDSVTDAIIGRKVSLVGEYVSQWEAPGQAKNKSWDVGLFKTKDNAMILVVRGFHKNENVQLGESKIVGYLVPPQSAENKILTELKANQISRVDSALFVTKTELPLYAPFIQAISETPDMGYQPVPFQLGKKVPGFYWQHISYVVIWCLFAMTAIYLMIYQRRLDKVAQ